ncbi:hypothetical protein ARMGADRAFT_1049118 [Armillaria gallica]|uniref:Terpenoid synthase n=1 Tax=Armillaria gallica TaxID=47427 RepID=A0A2H3CE90_ARMGA|nr:hypothetical protein ARMGADRAFT_1049118 [Armillaria gallica]
MLVDKAARHARFDGERLDYITGEGMPKDAIEWYERNLDYSVSGGKSNRCMSVVNTAEIIKGLMDDEYLKAAVLGWGIELAVIYYLLRKHFRRERYYVHRYSGTFLEATGREVYLSKFSLKKYSLTMIYKTAYYSFYLPVAVAARHFLDFSGTPEQIGTDILVNKCLWSRRILDDNYGRKDSECERRVKVVFESPEVKRYGVYEKIYGEIPEVEGKSTLKREVFDSFIDYDKIYSRTK